jgi:hypothetical protein
MLFNSFAFFEHNGWKYDFVKTTEHTADKGIAMERLEGLSFIDDESFDEEHYYHAGIWLGHLHNQTNVKRGGVNVKVYGDFTLQNIYINDRTQKITAIDPGRYALEERKYYYDIFQFFKAPILLRYRRGRKYNKKCVERFIAGYSVCSKVILSERILRSSQKNFF